ncbi:MAG: hypothetical protein J7K23_02550 [Thermoproteales archaeon]|nr:hypothetical protein [Thermoproteales archaeon]
MEDRFLFKKYHPSQYPTYYPPPKKKFPLIPVIVLIVLVGLGAFAVYTYFNGMPFSSNQEIHNTDQLPGMKNEYKVRFKYVIDTQGKKSNGIFIITRKGDKEKIEFTQSGLTILGVTSPDGGFVCIKTRSKWSCFKKDNPKSSTQIITPEDIKEDMNAVEPAGQKNVAGQSCNCWKGTIIKDNKKEENMICLTGDGIPTYMETKVYTDNKLVTHMIFTADGIWRTVDDNEFNPPAKIKG